ncbi:hypothetical protein [Microbacterium sp.]|uniref:hypothetical protein n=1 Tax=Microbacterium sp. TaxID=51671 RepID=UPI0039E246F5
MEILLAYLVGAAVGALLHFLMAGRDTRGAALGPVLGALIGAAVWLAMTWTGATTLEPWIWLASFAAPLLVAPLILMLRRVRAAHDERERARLGLV